MPDEAPPPAPPTPPTTEAPLPPPPPPADDIAPPMVDATPSTGAPSAPSTPDADDAAWDALGADNSDVEFGRPLIDKQLKNCEVTGIKPTTDPDTESASVLVTFKLLEKAVSTNKQEVFPGATFNTRFTTRAGKLESGEVRARISWEGIGRLAVAAGTLTGSSASKAALLDALRRSVGKKIAVSFKVKKDKNDVDQQNFSYAKVK